MTARVAAAEPPYSPDLQAIFERMMPPGVPPLTLFTTLASDRRLFDRFRKGGLLDQGHLTLHQREIVIDRTTALSGSEYEWGIHAAFFATGRISARRSGALWSGERATIRAGRLKIAFSWRLAINFMQPAISMTRSGRN